MSDLATVLEPCELANQVPGVIDAQYREISVYSPSVHRSRSVLLPAGLLSLAICAAPVAIYAAIVWGSP